MCGVRAHVIPNRVALVGPTEALPNLDPLPLCSVGERASRSCVVLDGRQRRCLGVAGGTERHHVLRRVVARVVAGVLGRFHGRFQIGLV